MKKINISALIQGIKKSIEKEVPKPKVGQTGPRVRDMRQEAMDNGSHGAKEYFGGPKE